MASNRYIEIEGCSKCPYAQFEIINNIDDIRLVVCNHPDEEGIYKAKPFQVKLKDIIDNNINDPFDCPLPSLPDPWDYDDYD